MKIPWPHREWVLNAIAVAATCVAFVAAVNRIWSGPGISHIPDEYQPRIFSDWTEAARGGPRQGRRSPGVTVTFFFDYRCPHCAVADGTLDSLSARHSEQVSVVYRHYPLTSPLSHRAAAAAVCAHRAGRFHRMHDSLFSSPDSIGIVPWTQIAVSAGVEDTVAYQSCLESQDVEATVDRHRAWAEKIGYDATPVILLDSLALRGNPGLEFLSAYVREISSR